MKAIKIALLAGGIAFSAAPAMALHLNISSGIQVGGGVAGGAGGTGATAAGGAVLNEGNGVGNTHSSVSGDFNGNTGVSAHQTTVTKSFTLAPITNSGALSTTTLDIAQ